MSIICLAARVLIAVSFVGCGLQSPQPPATIAELHDAIESGNAKQAADLLRRTPELVNTPDDQGNFPLHLAVSKAKSNVAAVLLAKSAKVDAVNNDGQTALHLACSSEAASRLATLLLTHNPNVDARDKQGNSPLSLAFAAGNAGMIGRFVAKTKQLDFETQEGLSLLHWAVANNRPDVVRVLIDRKVAIDQTNSDGETALHVAAWDGRDQIAGSLLSAGADVNAVDESDRTALDAAAWNGNLEVVRLLLAKGARGPDKPRTYSPLHAAAWQGHDQVIAALLVHGFDKNVLDSDGNTPLHKAAWKGHHAVVQVLLDHGADKNITTDDGFTALDLAKSKFGENKSPAALKKNARGYGPEQVIGRPDTPNAGDISTAWASATADGQAEWLIVEYENTVEPATVEIYENYNPGAVNKVSVFSQDGREIDAWSGKDPTPAGSGKGVSKINLKTTEKTRRIKIYVDSRNVSGWNEIDAVSLIDKDGNKQWAAYVRASSTYASGPVPEAGHRAVIRLLQ